MVAWAGGYYGELFPVERGVTQRDTLSPTIFNVVVDMMVRHWESLVMERVREAAEITMATQHSR